MWDDSYLDGFNCLLQVKDKTFPHVRVRGCGCFRSHNDSLVFIGVAGSVQNGLIHLIASLTQWSKQNYREMK
jgi:hypothetical protein